MLTYYKSADEQIDPADEAVHFETIAPMRARESSVYSDARLPVPYESGPHYYGVCVALHNFKKSSLKIIVLPFRQSLSMRVMFLLLLA